jgi:hypothetical protein
MTTCFVDESGTDTNLPIAVVAGLLLDDRGYFWLDVEWAKILRRFGINGPIHMREFTPNGEFKALTHGDRRALFSELVRAINEHKLVSFAATLTAEQYRQHFGGVTKLSMYAACFANLVMLSGTGLEKHGPHRWPLSFVLDDGNAYKQQVIDGMPALLKAFPRVAKMEFLSDSEVRALQAADVLSRAVRRDLSATFAHGFEPLEGLFDDHHLNLEYKAEWMRGVAGTIQISETCG